ncbi:MAG TPA: squalene synthase HpnC [Ignavibacteriaceae bacterium]|nr:squalene synthase HpnC [Ignavibacteriaceae bacterium]
MSYKNFYNQVISFAKTHYENFPVISFLIPKKLQKHIAVIYWFARTADDLADEGNSTPEVKLKQLNDFEINLTNALKGSPRNDFESALINSIHEKNLSTFLFYDLLKAFKQDVLKKRYENFNELLDYCKHSANPVGRLILELFNIRNEEAFKYSDMICTALQLTNFYQDLQIDFQKGRIYLPNDEMHKFGVEEKLFELKENSLNLQKLLRHNIGRTEEMFKEGRGLLKFLKGRLKFEIGWTILSGEAILKKITEINFNTINIRPELNKTDHLKLVLKAMFL